jgi:hypothetical protein
MLRLDETYDTFNEKGERIAQSLNDPEKWYRKIAETVPGPEMQDPASTQRREHIFSQEPEHYATTRSGFTGYWVETDAPTSGTATPTEPQQPAKAPTTAPQQPGGQGDQGEGQKQEPA